MTEDIIIEDVEWYNGHQAHCYPRRVKAKGAWYDVFFCERTIHEDVKTHQRTLRFHCHLGDGQVIKE